MRTRRVQPARGNYRVGFEAPWKHASSLRHPAEFPSNPRSLVTPASYAPAHYAPGPPPIPESAKRSDPFAGLQPHVKELLEGLERLLERPIVTQELPFPRWRVDQVTLTNTAITWLDQFLPAVAGAQRFLDGRRALIIVNHDTANHIFIRQADQAVASGGYIAAGGSISLPLGSRAKVFATASAASSLISFYQFG